MPKMNYKQIFLTEHNNRIEVLCDAIQARVNAETATDIIQSLCLRQTGIPSSLAGYAIRRESSTMRNIRAQVTYLNQFISDEWQSLTYDEKIEIRNIIWSNHQRINHWLAYRNEQPLRIPYILQKDVR